MVSNQLRFVKDVLYQLSKQYGTPLDIYRVTSSTADTTTGRKTVAKTVCNIKRAIVLPSDVSSRFVYNHTYIAADKQFTYGGLFDINVRTVIVDKRKIPSDWDLKGENFYAVCDGVKYDFKLVTQTIDHASWVIILKAIEGTPPAQVINLNVYQTLRFVHTAGGST